MHNKSFFVSGGAHMLFSLKLAGATTSGLYYCYTHDDLVAIQAPQKETKCS